MEFLDLYAALTEATRTGKILWRFSQCQQEPENGFTAYSTLRAIVGNSKLTAVQWKNPKNDHLAWSLHVEGGSLALGSSITTNAAVSGRVLVERDRLSKFFSMAFENATNVPRKGDPLLELYMQVTKLI